MGEYLENQLNPHYSIGETLGAVDQELQALFDLDGLAAALRKSGADPIDTTTFERERQLAGQPAGHLSFYAKERRADSVSLTPLTKFSTTHEGLQYPTFCKREDLQPALAGIAVRGVRAAALASLRQPKSSTTTFVVPGHAHTMAAHLTARQLTHQLAKSGQEFAVVSIPTPDMPPPFKAHLARTSKIVFGNTQQTIDNATRAVKAYAGRSQRYLPINPSEDAAAIAGQATAVLEYVAQLKAMDIDTRKHRINLRVPVEHGTAFIGAAVVWRWLKENELLTRGSRLIAVQAEGNDAMARTLQGEAPLTLGGGEHRLDTSTYPTGALTTSRRIIPVIQEFADDIQIVPPEYLIRACSMNVLSDRPLPGLAESLSLAAVLMDAEEGRLDQSIPELTITKGVSPQQQYLEVSAERYMTSTDERVAKAATHIVTTIREREAQRQAKATPPSPESQKPTSKAVSAKQAAPVKKTTPATDSLSKPRASESHRQGLRVWRGPQDR